MFCNSQDIVRSCQILNTSEFQPLPQSLFGVPAFFHANEPNRRPKITVTDETK